MNIIEIEFYEDGTTNFDPIEAFRKLHPDIEFKTCPECGFILEELEDEQGTFYQCKCGYEEVNNE